MSGSDENGAGPEKGHKLLSAGHFLKSHGIHGDIKFEPYFPHFLSPSDLEPGIVVWADSEDAEEPEATALPVTVRSAREYGNVWLLSFVEFTTPEGVKRLTNNDMWIERELIPPLPEGEFLDIDLIGCVVTDEELGELGAIREVIHTGANDVWDIEPYPGEFEGKDILIPVVGHVVLEVDIEAGKTAVKLPEGLLD